MKALIFMFAIGCAAPVGTTGMVSAPHDSAPRCGDICHDLGLGLDSVVVMANNVGCVCSAIPPAPAGPPSATPPATAHARAAAGGMAAIELDNAERDRQYRDAH
jgi:hypothetical protein